MSPVYSATMPAINVRDYGAKGDGVTNDTAAIQAALDASFAAPTRVPVHLPAGTFMFSNLKINATVILRGASMSVTKLKRITGSTGIALREKTAAEGNASGASGIWLRDFHIDGNATAGDGFNIGNQVGGAQLNFLASMENLWAANFPSGTGMIINTNAMKNSYLWSNTNSKGFVINGGGSMWDGIWAENNTNTDIEIASIGDTFSHVQTETAASAKPIVVTGNANRLLGVYAALGGTGIVRVVELQGTLNHVLDLLITTNSNTFTHGVYQTTAAVGTGSSMTTIPEWYDRKLVQKFGVGQTAATYSASITLNMTTSEMHYINATNTSAFTINAPLNAQSGMRLIVWIQNGSGGTLGTVTWDAVFKLAGAFTNPANGKGRMVEFLTNGTNWFEISRTAADF